MRDIRLLRSAPAALLYLAFLTILLLSSEPAVTKNCTSSDIELVDQGDVNLFQQAFGGGGTCDTITGTLHIEDTGGTDISDLTPLNALRYVNGDLVVYGTYVLETLDGLEGIRRVGGDLEVSYNGDLRDCSALYNLLEATPTTQAGVSGEVFIADNASGCNSRAEIVDAVKYNLVSCPVYEYDPWGIGLPFYKLSTQTDVAELRQITGGKCNKLPGLLWIGNVDAGGNWQSFDYEITDISELAWIKNTDFLAVRGNTLLTSLQGLHNLVGSFQGIDVIFTPIESLDPLSKLSSQSVTHSQISEGWLELVGTNIKTLDPVKSIVAFAPEYYWSLIWNPLLADCEWAENAEPYVAEIGANAPGCNNLDEVITYWGQPRHELTLSASPGGALAYDSVTGGNGDSLYGGLFGFPVGPSVPVPEGLNYTFSPSPISLYEFSDFLSNCNGGPRSSTQEFLLSSMKDDCYLHINYSRESTDPGSVASAKTISGSSCKVEQPALEPGVEWREQGLLNVSDEPVEVICPLPRTSYVGRDQHYFSDESTVAITFSVDEVSSAHTECTLIASESVAELVTPARTSFRLHGWATDSGEITINPESYPVPSQPDVLSHHAMRCLLQPGVGISGLKIESIN